MEASYGDKKKSGRRLRVEAKTNLSQYPSAGNYLDSFLALSYFILLRR